MAAPMLKTIPCRIVELRLDRTLACGQSFRWKESKPGEWTGVIGMTVWRLTQSDSELSYKVFKRPNQATNKTGVKYKDRELNDEAVLRDYLQLDVNLESLYQQWAAADTTFEKIAQHYTGIRILRQDPVECLFSFICSSNNNISRITSMVDKLATTYGKKIIELDGQEYYTFPDVSALCGDGVEDKLRTLGFGYRAKYIQTSARYIEAQGGEEWLYKLRSMEYKDAKAQLMKLCGVGAKVADCVSLFCCDKPGTIPVDTHVWQIAARDYLPKLKQAKSLTDKLYEEIGDHFRSLWGSHAGWAHSTFMKDVSKANSEDPDERAPVLFASMTKVMVLFTADLKQFKDQAKTTENTDTKGKRKNKEEAVKSKTKEKKPKKGR